MGIFEDAERGARLREHIRQLLYDYAIEHLTTNHVRFTEQAVTELLSESLYPCPMTDTFSVRLPEDPFDVLTRLYSLDCLGPSEFEEEPSRLPEVVQYLRKFFTTLKLPNGVECRSYRAVDCEDKYATPEERFEPILSRRARRETPRPGLNPIRASLNIPHAAFLQSARVNALVPVPVPYMEEPSDSIDPESTLNVKWTLSLEIAPKVKDLLIPITTIYRPGFTHKNRYLDWSARPESPPLGLTSFWDSEIGFVPIFPRKKTPRHPPAARPPLKPAPEPKHRLLIEDKRPTKGFDGLAGDLSLHSIGRELSQVQTEEDEEDEFRRESMRIVDGWETYHSSPIQGTAPVLPKPSSSLTSSVTTPQTSQEVDQLDFDLNISSPNTEFTPIKLLMDSRMDLPVFPRSKRVDGAAGKRKKIGAKQSYAALILESVIQKKANARNSSPGPQTTRKDWYNQRASPSSPIPRFDPVPDGKSISGSPSSRNVPTIKVEHTSPSELDLGLSASIIGQASTSDSFDLDLEGIPGFQQLRDEDPKAFVMKERLDLLHTGPGQESLMSVPDLPPPNEHAPNDDVLFLAKKMADFVPAPPGTQKRAGNESNSKVYYQFLTQAKGVQSVTLQLSWIPFSVSEPLPTTEQVLGVDAEYVDHSTGILGAFERMGMSAEQGMEKVKGLIARAKVVCEEGSLLTPPGTSEESGYQPQDQTATAERVWAEWAVRNEQVNQKVIEDVREDSKLWRMETIVLSREERRRLACMAESGNSAEGGRREEGPVFPSEEQDETVDNGGSSEMLPVPHVGSIASMVPVSPPPPPLVSQQGDTYASQDHDLLFPRTETDFGIPYDLTISDEIPKDNLSYDHPMEDNFEIIPSVGGGRGYIDDSEYGGGYDSDKENQIPASMLLRAQNSFLMVPELYGEAVGDGLWAEDGSHLDVEEEGQLLNDGELYRPWKRPRLEDWEGQHEQDSFPRFDYAQEGNLEIGIDDSGIGFMPEPVLKPAGGQDEMSRFTVGGDVPPNEDDAHAELPAEAELSSNKLEPPGAHPSPHLQIPSSLSFLDHSAGIADFARLRARKLRTPPPPPRPAAQNPAPAAEYSTSDNQPGAADVATALRTAPDSLYDKNSLRLPPIANRVPPEKPHWYMGSINLLQKQALVRLLRSEDCGVGLVERGYLEGVDLIIDPHTAVIFFNILSLPSEVRTLIDNICKLSMRYDTIAVVFEAFAPSMAFKPDSKSWSQSGEGQLKVFSPPVIKAVRRLRRELAVAEAREEKGAGCTVKIAFADTVKEAAMFARMVGDEMERRDVDISGGVVWGDREWLEEELEDEQNLAMADCMNPFAACVILCQVSFDKFLGMVPEERVARFGPHVGYDRMTELNEVIRRGQQVMEEAEEDGSSILPS
ncbi:hypothetical protein D9757_006002 [Collybiopsis confluens]|uniref:Uncharacterized protein n=1 Tax=Collybiopsis confluens TaxID=2823264 RepID=A0A8H5HU98_9AGAR|nr:hypothetical protein D9757_006002 [Collybiopsis confluens]